MIGKASELERLLLNEKELKREIIKDFTKDFIAEVNKLLKERGKDEIVSKVNA